MHSELVAQFRQIYHVCDRFYIQTWLNRDCIPSNSPRDQTTNVNEQETGLGCADSATAGFDRTSASSHRAKMALTLRVRIEDKNVVKAMKFEPHTAVLDACRMIRERLADTTNITNRKWNVFNFQSLEREGNGRDDAFRL